MLQQDYYRVASPNKSAGMYVNFVVQATEDCDRLVSQIARNLGLGDVTTSIKIQHLSGHYGNAIAYVRIDVPEHRSKIILTKTVRGLNQRDRKHLGKQLQTYMDEKQNLYIRLDKQELYLGRLGLSQLDSVRLVTKISEGELVSLLG